jgi:hypothetical protein
MNENELLAKLADVDLPAPPDWRIPLMITLIATAAAVLFIYGIWHYLRHRLHHLHQHPAQQALRRLEHLRQEWESQKIGDREAAYHLATLLRLGLELPQLQNHRPYPHSDPASWRNMLLLLEHLRYRESTAEKLSPDVFRLAHDWLSAAGNTAPEHRA